MRLSHFQAHDTKGSKEDVQRWLASLTLHKVRCGCNADLRRIASGVNVYSIAHFYVCRQVLRSNTAMFYFMEFMERNHAMPQMQFLMLADRSAFELTKQGRQLTSTNFQFGG